MVFCGVRIISDFVVILLLNANICLESASRGNDCDFSFLVGVSVMSELEAACFSTSSLTSGVDGKTFACCNKTILS